MSSINPWLKRSNRVELQEYDEHGMPKHKVLIREGMEQPRNAKAIKPDKPSRASSGNV